MSSGTDTLYANLYDQMLHMIGLCLGVLLTGILLTLGAFSVYLLSSRRGGPFSRSNFLRMYTVILSLMVLVSNMETFVMENALVISSSRPPAEIEKFAKIWANAFTSTALATGLLSDGILVWRCFMVQRALGPFNSSKWGNLFWDFPACLWTLTLVTGSITLALVDVLNPSISIASNSALNIYATLFLTTRLLAHRKMARVALGEKAFVGKHLRIIGILLESAVINVPITIAVAVGLGTGRTFGRVIGLIAPSAQALASVIIIHQVALGNAFSGWRNEDKSRTQVLSESSLNL